MIACCEARSLLRFHFDDFVFNYFPHLTEKSDGDF